MSGVDVRKTLSLAELGLATRAEIEVANAAVAELIAAHKELLKLAESMSRHVYTTPPEKNDRFDRSRAALAAVTGESHG